MVGMPQCSASAVRAHRRDNLLHLRVDELRSEGSWVYPITPTSRGSAARAALSGRSQEYHPRRIVVETLFQGVGVMTPDGLPALVSIDLMRRL